MKKSKKSKARNPTSTACYVGRKKRKTSDDYSNLPFLSQEIIFNILIYLPADVLLSFEGRVCRSWDEILRNPSFVKTHLQRSNRSVLFHQTPGPDGYELVVNNSGDIQLSALECRSPCRILSSSGGVLLYGLILLFHDILFVANPATMQLMRLPRVKAFSPPSPEAWEFRISYIPDICEIKVLRYDVNFKTKSWNIITVGTDLSWRTIEAPTQLTHHSYYNCDVFSAGGVVYFASRNRAPLLFAFDLRTETTTVSIRIQSKMPREVVVEGDDQYRFLPLGDRPSVLKFNLRLKLGYICILKDLHRSEWELVYTFDTLPLGIFDESIAWLDEYRILMKYRKHRRSNPSYYSLAVHDFKTRKSQRITRQITSVEGDLLPHVSTLVSWKNYDVIENFF